MVPPIPLEDIIPPPTVSLHAVAFDNHNLARCSGSPFPGVSLGNLAVSSGMDQLHGRDDSRGFGFDDVSNVSNVFASSVFSPFDMLFPLSSSDFTSFPLPQSSSAPFSSSSSSSSFGFSTVASSLPPSSFPVFSLPSVVPSVLAISASHPPSSLPPPPKFPAPVSLPSLPSASPFVSLPFRSSFPLASAPPASFSLPSPLVSSSLPSVFPSSSASAAASSSSGDFASYQARVLGLSADYQALGRWFVQSEGSDFLSYLSSHFPHLSADTSRNFSSGSSLFLAALRSPASTPALSFPPPVPHGFPSSSASISSSLPHFGLPSDAPASSFPPPASSSVPFHPHFPSHASLSSFGFPPAPVGPSPRLPPLSTPLVPPGFPQISAALPPLSMFPSTSASFPSAHSVAPGLGLVPGAAAAPAVPAPRPLFRPFASSSPPLLRLLPLLLLFLRCPLLSLVFLRMFRLGRFRPLPLLLVRLQMRCLMSILQMRFLGIPICRCLRLFRKLFVRSSVGCWPLLSISSRRLWDLLWCLLLLGPFLRISLLRLLCLFSRFS